MNVVITWGRLCFLIATIIFIISAVLLVFHFGFPTEIALFVGLGFVSLGHFLS